MELKEFSLINQQRCEDPRGFNHLVSDWSASDWMTAVTGEVGETANIIKKLNRVRDGIPGNTQTEEELRQALRLELADVFCYLDLLATSLGVSLEDAVIEKWNLTSQRIGYPRLLPPAPIKTPGPPASAVVSLGHRELPRPELITRLCGSSIVRNNLLTVPGYAPYCGNDTRSCTMTRTEFDRESGQFVCSECQWRSAFSHEFIEVYRHVRMLFQVCSKCGVSVKDRFNKYCGDGSNKDNEHRWVQPKY